MAPQSSLGLERFASFSVKEIVHKTINKSSSLYMWATYSVRSHFSVLISIFKRLCLVCVLFACKLLSVGRMRRFGLTNYRKLIRPKL